MHRAALLGTFLLACTTPGPPRVDDDGAFRGGLSPSISIVETFGLWAHEQDEGGLRLVVTKRCSPEHCADRAFLQWLVHRIDRDDGSVRTREVATVELVELGAVAVVQSVVPAPAVDRPGRFELHAVNTYTLDPRTICVDPGPPSRYAASEGSCTAPP